MLINLFNFNKFIQLYAIEGKEIFIVGGILILSAIPLFLGSNSDKKKAIFKGLRCINCGKNKNFKFTCECGKNSKLFYLTVFFITFASLIFSLIKLNNLTDFLIASLMIILLSSVSVSDIIERTVPDILVLIFGIVFLLMRILLTPERLLDSFLGMTGSFLFFLTIAYVGEKIYKREVLGGGDIKLYGVIGLILGLNLTFISIFIASLSGYIYSFFIKERDYIAFVPFISFGVLISYFYGKTILEGYLNLI